MVTLPNSSTAPRSLAHPADDAAAMSRLETRLPPLLSVIAGMVDLTDFFTPRSRFHCPHHGQFGGGCSCGGQWQSL